MHPFALLLIVVAAGAAVAHGHPAAISPSARFWEHAMPGTPMHARGHLRPCPQRQRSLSSCGAQPCFPSISVCGAWTGMCTASMAAATGIFFHNAQLRLGSTMDVSFPSSRVTSQGMRLS
ncbi:hypothetical protein EJB05_51651, partial [Eragrostis curvula]